ncbi:hypothetical protein QVD17_17280 [Tagetes erecta]|uniref:Uncharacterized protein n=1 Tax=Tagetes erecta TaxID=13708 RepID=A0AAD8P1D3_TARER|nr:hypothetical protein QVD17_17280 [Tagetes erecta]
MNLNLNVEDFLNDIRMQDLPPEDEFIDALAEHEYLMFPEDEVAQEKCNKLKKMAVGGHIAIDWTFLDEIAETNRARDIIGIDTPWARLFEAATNNSFRELTVEFLSSFVYERRPLGFVENPNQPFNDISFRLAGVQRTMTLREFAVRRGMGDVRLSESEEDDEDNE